MPASDPTSSPPRTEPNAAGDKSPTKRGPANWTLLVLFGLLAMAIASHFMPQPVELDYSTFHNQVTSDNVKSVVITGVSAQGVLYDPEKLSAYLADRKARIAAREVAVAKPADKEKAAVKAEPNSDAKAEASPSKFIVQLPVSQNFDVTLDSLLKEHNVAVTYDNTDYSSLIWNALLIAAMFGSIFLLWWMMSRSRDQMFGGGGIGGIIKSPARQYNKESDHKITFDDVAGLKNVKRDLKEIVEYLREPQKFQRLGAQAPKGVLLVGPPGTGKTLLAKAVAGEAGVPFYSINGSEFIQLFVGVGASRVRDLFRTAKKNAPAILFIDEIDAIGRQRGAGLGGGHDEREQTLNQILSEMDGFTPTETVIVIAATNRPDVLDPALLRPGRFDRHVTVDRPTIEGRKQLFEVHSRKTPLSENVDFDKLARATVGMTGADIKNLVNEAALWATRHDRGVVTMDDFEYARDKVLMGDRREDVLTEHEKRVTAYHEAGHTLVAWRTACGTRVHKVTIMPRGRALGVTQLVPEEDRHNMGQQEMQSRLAMLLAGRAAEKIAFEELSAGAESDLKEATKLARRMVTHWGMSERLGPVAYHTSEDHPFLGREIVQEHRAFSEHTAQVIDDEVSKLLHTAADRAKRMLLEHRPNLEAITQALLTHEELDEAELIALIGPPVADTDRAALNGAAVSPTPSPNS
jgi:cell division protease FtsH